MNRDQIFLVRDIEDHQDADRVAAHEAWTRELQRRWDEVRTGEVEPLTPEQFRQRVRERREAQRR